MNIENFDELYNLYNTKDDTKKYKVIFFKKQEDIDFERTYTIKNVLDFYSLYLYYNYIIKNTDLIKKMIGFVVIPLNESEYKKITLDDLIIIQRHIKYKFSNDEIKIKLN